jgi:hypothetical protein
MLVGVLDEVASKEDNAVAPLAPEVDESVIVEEAVETDIVVDESADETVSVSVGVVIAEVVVVFAVTRLSVPAVVCDDVSDDAVVKVAEEESLSGHMPIVHGSLEQHPRKPPAVQTYHSLPVVQVPISRGSSNSGTSMSRPIPGYHDQIERVAGDHNFERVESVTIRYFRGHSIN